MTAGLVALIIAATPALAEEPVPIGTELDNTIDASAVDRAFTRDARSLQLDIPQTTEWREKQGFVDAHFLPRVNRQFRRMGSPELAAFPGQDAWLDPNFDSVNTRAYTQFERAAGRAFKDYMLEVTTLDSLLGRIGNGMRSRTGLGASSEPGSAPSRSGVKFDVGISHMMPELVVKPRIGEGTLRFTLSSRGSVALRYRNERFLGGTRVRAKFNPVTQRYTLGCVLGF